VVVIYLQLYLAVLDKSSRIIMTVVCYFSS